MKKIMKVVSLVLTFALLLGAITIPSVATSAAAKEGDNKIILKPTGTIDISNNTYTAYRLFDLDAGSGSDNYTWPSELVALDGGTKDEMATDGYVGKLRSAMIKAIDDYHTAKGESDKTVGTSADRNDIIQHLGAAHKDGESSSQAEKNDNEEIEEFAKAMYKWLSSTSGSSIAAEISYTSTQSSSGTDQEFVNIPFGYYLIVDTTAGKAGGANAEVYSALIVANADINPETIYIKASQPTLEKEIDGSSNGLNTASVGDVIKFKLTTKAPDYIGYDMADTDDGHPNRFKFYITDTLSKGLAMVKLNEDGTTADLSGALSDEDIIVKLGGVKVATTNYSVDGPTASGSDGAHTITITFLNSYLKALTVGTEITIEYAAKLTAAAGTGTSGAADNQNKAVLTYSNDPQTGTTGTTTSDTTTTYSFALNLTKESAKKGEEGTKLAGAKFTLKRNVGGKDMYAVVGSETPGGNDTSALEAVITGWTETEANATRFVTCDNTEPDNLGLVNIKGLGAGTYTLKEVGHPENYYPIDEEITFEIQADITSESTLKALAAEFKEKYDGVKGLSAATSKDVAGTTADGVIKFTILNTDVAKLPETGGMGTTLLYTIGGALVVIAGVLLISKRRMGAAR